MSKSLELSTDVSRLDFETIYEFLRNIYWAKGLGRERFKRAMAHSINVGAYDAGKLVGYARIVTDSATYAYLCDVFVVESHRGQGISKAMMRFIMDLPELQGIKRFALVTRGAHSLYRRFGFENTPTPENYMEINRGGYEWLNEF
jgi:GNAT superfamily N-acetyltransferase